MSALVQAGDVMPAESKPSSVDRLRTQAAEASQVRGLSTHPDVVALRVESVRTQVDRCMWVGIVLGLAFTMVNVQAFAAQGAVLWSLPWFAAWLLDPMVSLVLIAVLRAEQITARYQVSDHTKWIRRTKVFAFLATYAMNTWSSFLHGDVAGIVLHSVPPLLVFCAAETAPVLRDRLTEAVLRAENAAVPADPAGASQPLTTPTPAVEAPEVTTGPQTAPEAIESKPATKAPRKATQARRKAAKPGRKLLADYVTDARKAVEPGMTPDQITPAWARRASGCSVGLSAKVAAAVRADLTTTTTETTTDDAAAAGEPARIAA